MLEAGSSKPQPWVRLPASSFKLPAPLFAARISPVRILLFVALLSAVSLAQSTSDDYDEFGFPITFDAQIVTRNVVIRSFGVESESALGGPLKNSRDIYLMQKLLEKVGELYGIEISQREVKDIEARQIAAFKSEADYYDDLLQNGLTPTTNQQKIRNDLLQAHLGQLFRFGFLARGQRLLPWDPAATPREILIAYKNDPQRLNAGSLVKWRELLIDIPAAERKKAQAARIVNPNLTDAHVEAQIRAKVEPLAIKAGEMLKAGKSLAEIAAELNLKVREAAREVTSQASKEPATLFLQKAKAGERSDLLELKRSRWLILEVDVVHRPGDVSLSDPKLVMRYKQMVGELKQAKAEYLLRLRALDKTDIRPARVKRDLRTLCLDRLHHAQRKLRELGLH